MVTVFTTGPSCHKCFTTKIHLKKRGVEFEEIRIDQDRFWLDTVMSHGFTTAPVVLVNDEDVWEGYSGESIDEWAKELVQTAA